MASHRKSATKRENVRKQRGDAEGGKRADDRAKNLEGVKGKYKRSDVLHRKISES